MHDIKIRVGQPLKFKATFIGEPSPEVAWSHEGTAMQNTKRITIVNTSTSTDVDILNADRQDSGMYTMTLTNSSGRDSVTVNVSVTGKAAWQTYRQILYILNLLKNYTDRCQ